jgi:hypothetical protein
MSNAGISVWASQKEKTSFGPVIRSYVNVSYCIFHHGKKLTFGVKPLKKLLKPSFFIIFPTILKPPSGFSKFLFWIRVLITSSGAETTRDAEAPAIEAMKFWNQVALL